MEGKNIWVWQAFNLRLDLHKVCHNMDMATFHSNGVDLYYESCGAGEPLLLLHGLGSSTRDWEMQVGQFAQHYRVIACDMRGHGRSSKPPGPYSMRAFAQDTAALLTALGTVPAHVVGLSMGGMIAFELALHFPEILKSLTVVNSYPEMRVETPAEYFQMWQRFLILDLLGMRKMGEVLSKRLFIKPGQAELRRMFVERWAENDKQAYKASLRAILGWDVEGRLGEIRCPVLVIASDGDYMPLEDKRNYVAKIPNARLAVIEDARHAVTVEKPEQFNRFLDEFLISLHELA